MMGIVILAYPLSYYVFRELKLTNRSRTVANELLALAALAAFSVLEERLN